MSFFSFPSLRLIPTHLQTHLLPSSQSLSATKTELQTVEKELQDVQKTSRTSENRRDTIDEEVEKIDRTLRDARDFRRRNREEERLLSAIESLKKHFSGVQGRLVDLCRPTQRRFNMAVTVAAGKDMDAIVVDTKKTAFECIQYLRDQRVGTATFLPLDGLKVPSPQSIERFRALTGQDGRFYLAADCIDCDDHIKPAVLYSVSNTIICDQLDSARELCFGRTRRTDQDLRIKAVTLKGHVISKAGTMTGGVTRDDKSSSSRWDEAELDKLRAKKDDLETERAELEGLANAHNKIEELRSAVGNLKNRDQFAKSDLEYTTKQLSEKRTLLRSLENQLVQSNAKRNEAEKDIRSLTADIEVAVKAVKEAEDQHLKPFCDATGLRDVQAYEDAMGKTREDFNKRRGEILEHTARLEQQLDYESNRDFAKPIDRVEKRIKARTKALADAQEQERALKKEADEAKTRLEEAAVAVKEASDKEKEFDESVKAAQQRFSEAQANRVETSKAITTEESALERLRGKLHETLQKSRVEEVDLPMLGSDGGHQRGSRRGRAGRSTRRTPGADDAEDEEQDDGSVPVDESSSMEEDVESSGNTRSSRSRIGETQETQGTVRFSQEEDARVVRDKEAAAKVDFSKMKQNLKQRLSDRDERRMRKEFEEQLARVAAQIEGMTPNMKAAEAYDVVSQRLKDSSVDFDKAKSEARKATTAFQKGEVAQIQRGLLTDRRSSQDDLHRHDKEFQASTRRECVS